MRSSKNIFTLDNKRISSPSWDMILKLNPPFSLFHSNGCNDDASSLWPSFHSVAVVASVMFVAVVMVVAIVIVVAVVIVVVFVVVVLVVVFIVNFVVVVGSCRQSSFSTCSAALVASIDPARQCSNL